MRSRHWLVERCYVMSHDGRRWKRIDFPFLLFLKNTSYLLNAPHIYILVHCCKHFLSGIFWTSIKWSRQFNRKATNITMDGWFVLVVIYGISTTRVDMPWIKILFIYIYIYMCVCVCVLYIYIYIYIKTGFYYTYIYIYI